MNDFFDKSLVTFKHDREALNMRHDRLFCFMESLIVIAAIIVAILVFICGAVLMSYDEVGRGFLLWIFGSLGVFVGFIVSKFILSVVYDIKIIRNQTLKMICSKNRENVAEEKVSDDSSLKEFIDQTKTDGEI